MASYIALEMERDCSNATHTTTLHWR